MQNANSSFSSLMLLILKDVRFERNIHQGVIAQHCGKTPSAWNKIESGQSPLTVDALFGACSALGMAPSYFMNVLERLVPMFNLCGYYFHSISITTEEDDLLPLITSYFNSSGYDALKGRFNTRVGVMAVTGFLPTPTPTIVQYCCDPAFRKWIDEGAPDVTNMSA